MRSFISGLHIKRLVAIVLCLGLAPVAQAETAAPPFSLMPQEFDAWNAIAAFSPDGHLMATGSSDVRIWHLKTGKIVRVISSARGGVKGLAFTPDGKTLISASESGLMFWNDVESGNQLGYATPGDHRLQSIALSPDGLLLVSGDYEGVRFWNATSRELVRTVKTEQAASVLGFSRDGKLLLSLSHASLEVRDGASGELLCAVKDQSLRLAISPDDSQAALAGDDSLSLLELAPLRARTAAKECALRKTKIFGSYISDDEKIRALTFSADGKSLRLFARTSLATWDVATMKRTGSVPLAEEPAPGGLMPDGKSFVALVAKKVASLVKLVSIPAGEEVQRFEIPQPSRVYGAHFLRGSHDVYVPASGDDFIKMEFESGKGMRRRPRLISSTWSGDGQRLAGRRKDQRLEVWDAAERVLHDFDLKNAAGKKLAPGSLQLNPDGSQIVGMDGKDLLVFDATNGTLLRTINSPIDLPKGMHFSPDGKRLVVMGYGKDYSSELGVWDLATGALLDSDRNRIGPNDDLLVSRDGRWAAWPAGPTLLVRDLSAKTTRSISAWERASGFAFTPDSKMVALAFGWGELQFIDLATLEVVKTVNGLTGTRGITFSDDGKYLLGHNGETLLTIRNLQNGQQVLFKFAGDDWIAYTPDGYFDGSKDGGRLLAIVDKTEPFAVDQFAAIRNRPDILLERLQLGSPELSQHYRQQYQKRLRRLGLSEKQLTTDFHAPLARIDQSAVTGKFVDLGFSCSDDRFELTRYDLFVNDVPLHGAAGIETPKGRTFQGKEKVELTEGANKIEVSCRDSAGAESYRALTVANYKTAVARDLYYLGFGVSKYQRAELNLGFADKDARDLGALLERRRGDFANVHVKTFLNEQVTAANIAQAKSFLEKARPDDVFILFIAGHGVHDKDAESTYYYLTHQADPEALASTAVNFDQIENLMQGIAPRKKLFLMDTCESGEAEQGAAVAAAPLLASATSRGIKRVTAASAAAAPPPRAYLQSRDRYIYNDLLRRSGAIVFSSSRGGELSYEDSNLKNGYFTAEIMAALSSPIADANQDRQVSTDELRSYVAKAVAARTNGLQNPTVDRDNLEQKFGFSLVTPAPAAPPAPARKPKRRR